MILFTNSDISSADADDGGGTLLKPGKNNFRVQTFEKTALLQVYSFLQLRLLAIGSNE
jgi:hypothetical protein